MYIFYKLLARQRDIERNIYELEDSIKELLSEKEYNSVEKYAEKIYQTMFLERKKAFTYGYQLSNKMIIDSLK